MRDLVDETFPAVNFWTLGEALLTLGGLAIVFAFFKFVVA